MLARQGRIALSAVIVAGLVLALGLFSHRSVAEKSASSPHTLTIVFTGDDWGNVKPCGCGSKGHLGGVSRRATYVSQLRESFECSQPLRQLYPKLLHS